MKFVRSQKTTTGQACQKYKSWTWAKQMEFIRPHLKFATTTSNVSLELPEASNDSQEEPPLNEGNTLIDDSDARNSSEEITQQRKRVRRCESSQSNSSMAVEKVISYLESSGNTCRNAEEKYDAIEHLFLGYAKTVKTFSAKRQTAVKLKIAQIVFEEEAQQQEEEEMTNVAMSSFSSTPLNSPILLTFDNSSQHLMEITSNNN